MYVSTSLATLIDQSNVWIGYKKNLSGYSEELNGHLMKLFNFEAHISVRDFILTCRKRFVNSFLNNFLAFGK